MPTKHRKPDLPRHRRNRFGDAVRPVQVRLLDDVHDRVVEKAKQNKRTVPEMIAVFVDQALERENNSGTGTAAA